MTAYLPLHFKPSGHFVDLRSLYVLCLAAPLLTQSILPAQLSISIFLVATVAINVFSTGVYGGAWFVFTSIKAITFISLIIVGHLIGGPTYDSVRLPYWRYPGRFVQYSWIEGATGRFLAQCAVMVQAALLLRIGTEMVAAENPRQNLRAIRRVYGRILLFSIDWVATAAKLSFADTITMAPRIRGPPVIKCGAAHGVEYPSYMLKGVAALPHVLIIGCVYS
ncbi:hypothetical protein DAEQUDRAFT_770160 [Daedalea quercina L-15889]|uniref:Amino acid permease/ SLC12A domain-containing protein n=1 Tax=Daedalea quercina L-15889 TaxID=1314783 RepID=A0A165L3N7_9APHY|nr:hypothetical protein DAEQUDRAFT_770160 [Daedalea quercina L-15889]